MTLLSLNKTAYMMLRIDLTRCDDIVHFKNKCLSDNFNKQSECNECKASYKSLLEFNMKR